MSVRRWLLVAITALAFTAAVISGLICSHPLKSTACSSSSWPNAHRRPQQRELMMSGGCGDREEILSIIYRKKQEVEKLNRDAGKIDSPLRMRLSYHADRSTYRVRQALRRKTDLDAVHQLAVLADMKRRSPTAKSLPKNFAEYDDASSLARSFVSAGADVIFVNTDHTSYGSDLGDLDEVRKEMGKEGPPVVMKDFIIHPVQIALAAEHGASGVTLIACVLGPALEDLLDVCTAIGVEAIVEVHTPAECEKALEYGSTAIMVNNWDRVTGLLHPQQAMGIRSMIPNEVISIAGGGLSLASQCAPLADVGYDAVVIGRALALSSDPLTLIKEVRGRRGLPRRLLGLGLRPDDLEVY